MKEKSNFSIAGRFEDDHAADKKNRWLARLIVAWTVCLGVLNSGCAPSRGITCPGPGAGSDSVFEKVAFNGVQFKVKIAEDTQNLLLPADNFWFADGDDKTIEYGWNEAFYQVRDADAPRSCNHPTPSQGCRQCNFCDGSCNDGTSYGLVISGGNFGDLFEFGGQSGLLLIQQVANPGNGCLMRSGNQPLPSFTPLKDTNYILWMKDYCGNTLSGQTMLTKVVTNARLLQQKLEPYGNDADPALRFKFQMPVVGGKLQENFSTNLKVGKVRVLRGKIDPASGKEIVLEDPTVRPSRILFLPDFRDGDVNNSPTENINRCYLDVSKEDGGFDLQNCRPAPGGGTPRVFDTPGNNVTPTFIKGRVDMTTGSPNLRETLTWVIEYKMESGLTELPTFNDGSYPILEWEIK